MSADPNAVWAQPVGTGLSVSLTSPLLVEGVPALRIGSGPQTLALQLSNIERGPLRLLPLSDDEAYHFRLSLRPLTLAHDLDSVGLSARSEADGWRLRRDRSARDGRQVFLLGLPASLVLTPGETVAVGLIRLRPDPARGARLVEAAVNYDNFERTPGEVLRGHGTLSLSITQIGDEVVPLRQARTGRGAMSPLFVAWMYESCLRPNAETALTVILSNNSGRDIAVRGAGTESSAAIRLPFVTSNESLLFLNNRGVLSLDVGEASRGRWTLSPDGRSIVPIKDFVLPAKTKDADNSSSVEIIIRKSAAYAGRGRFPCILQYDNFGEDGQEAGELIVEFDITNVFEQQDQVLLLNSALTFGDGSADCVRIAATRTDSPPVEAARGLYIASPHSIFAQFRRSAVFGDNANGMEPPLRIDMMDNNRARMSLDGPLTFRWSGRGVPNSGNFNGIRFHIEQDRSALRFSATDEKRQTGTPERHQIEFARVEPALGQPTERAVLAVEQPGEARPSERFWHAISLIIDGVVRTRALKLMLEEVPVGGADSAGWHITATSEGLVLRQESHANVSYLLPLTSMTKRTT